MRRRILILMAVSVFLWPIALQAEITYELIDLGTLGGDWSAAQSINGAGQVVGSAVNSDGQRHAALFDPTGSGNNIDLGTLGGGSSEANLINNAGQILGESLNSNGDSRATLFDPTGAGYNIDLGTLGGDDSCAYSINDTGQIVGQAQDIRGWKYATLFDPTGEGNNINLGTLAEGWSCAYVINEAGQVVGWADDGLWDNRAVLFDLTAMGKIIDLGTLGGNVSEACSINSAGQIVGWDGTGNGLRIYGHHTVLFDPTGEGNNIDLGTLGGAEAQARSINDVGQIVGDAEDSQDYWSAALFDPSGAGNNIDLNTLIDPASGWTLRFAYDINNSGWIVGRGWNPQGKVRAFLLVPKSPSKYSGGTGEPDDPYQIAMAEDLMLLGDNPEDYDKHFILIADIDLDPNLPGRKVFNMAVIAADTNGVEPDFQGIPFKGVFDGNLHDISHLTIVGDNYLGLFGRIDKTARISNLALKAVNVKGTSDCIGGLAGYNLGAIIQCSVNGTVEGKNRIGGLVGDNAGPITRCSTNCLITGNQYVGGLLGFNWTADISACFSSSRVVGISWVGGLVGISGYISSPPAGLAGPPPGSISYPPETIISSCYSTGHVEGGAQVGGLAGENKGSIQFSYSAARVEDSVLLLVDNTSFGGLVGTNNHGVVLLSFWDAELSNLPYSTAGRGRTTEQMMDANTFSGWGYSGEWVIDEGNDYPRLAWEGLEGKPIIDTPNRYAGGTGIPDDPYKIHTSDELIRLSNHPIDWDKCFVLTSNIDFNHVDPNLISPIGVYGMPFKGSFNGNHYTISNFHCLSEAESYIGVFGSIGPEISYRSYATMSHDPNDSGSVMNLNIENVRVLGYNCVGGVAGYNSGIISNCSVTGNVTAVSKDAGSLLGFNDGEITECYAIGNVKSELVAGGLIGHNKGPIKGCSFSGNVEEEGTHGGSCSGGLIGYNYSTVDSCHFNGDITGSYYTGGLIGLNGSTVSNCFALGNVTGTWCVGGLVGRNGGTLMNCYAIGSVKGTEYVAGLTGLNDNPINSCYSSCIVIGQQKTGGLVGDINYRGEVSNSFWDVETSGQIISAGGIGKITAEMQTAATFLDAGWDFVGETANGTEDIWWINEGRDYPRLWWEAAEQ